MAHITRLLEMLEELEREYENPNLSGLGLACEPPRALRRRQEPGLLMPNLLMSLLEQRRQLGLTSGDEQQGDAGTSTVGEDGFQACMDVAHFKPNELSVRVTDRNVIVKGKHEERADNHGFIARQFIRRYVLPDGYDGDKVHATLSSDGVLTVSAPKPQANEQPDQRLVQIQQTGPAALNVKQNGKGKPDSEGQPNGTNGNSQQ